jgi:predicted permease
MILHLVGPLVLVAVLYEVLGVALAWTVKQFFWVPHRFRYGILVAGGWGNVGDIRELRAIFSLCFTHDRRFQLRP